MAAVQSNALQDLETKSSFARVRDIIDSCQFTGLATTPMFLTRDFRAVPQTYRTLIPEYVKDYVSLNEFAR